MGTHHNVSVQLLGCLGVGNDGIHYSEVDGNTLQNLLGKAYLLIYITSLNNLTHDIE